MPRAVGINHIALEVGSIDEALAFYGRLFELELRGRVPGMAFVDLGDQFLALAERQRPASPTARGTSGSSSTTATRCSPPRARPASRSSAATRSSTRGATTCRSSPTPTIQFSKTPEILRGMGLELEKTESAQRELRDKGLA